MTADTTRLEDGGTTIWVGRGGRYVPWPGLPAVLDWLVPFVGLLVVQQVLFPAPLGIVASGALVGGRIALIALGLALVYRANRVVNFAQGDLGGVPATLGVMLVVSWGWGYWQGFVAGLVAAVVLGVLVEALIIRRFFTAPRLVVTVATIGLAQLLTAAALLVPRAFGDLTFASQLPQPFGFREELAGTYFYANDLVTAVVVPLAFLALWLFLRFSVMGVAIVGAAERADRAAGLGIPVKRLHTVVWVLASVLAFVAMYLRAGSVGLPIGTVLPPTFLVQALAAAVLGRFERLPTIAIAAIGLGILDQAIVYQPGSKPAYGDAALFVVVLIGLLVIRGRRGTNGGSGGRVDADATTWQATREVRPIPKALAGLPEVRAARAGLWVALGALLVTLPFWLSTSRLQLATLILLFGIVATSLVVLTGWAGQVSLGHMAFVGLGAAVGGALTEARGWILPVTMLVTGLAGAGAAVVVGYPALRRRGLTLAVSTLAFALLTSAYLLNRTIFDWLPGRRIEPATLLPTIRIGDTTLVEAITLDGDVHLFGFTLPPEARLFYVCLVVLGLALLVVSALRRTRTGRVLIAIRENERAARAYGVDATRTTLAAFALSGFLAAVAGSLFVHQQAGLSGDPYLPQRSLELFSMVVIGGLGSLPGALLGAAYVQSADFFLPLQWQFLATGVGLLLVLLLFPAGLGSLLTELRDTGLRWVARRRMLAVPSLMAEPATADRAMAEPARADAPTTGTVEDEAAVVGLDGEVPAAAGVAAAGPVEPGRWARIGVAVRRRSRPLRRLMARRQTVTARAETVDPDGPGPVPLLRARGVEVHYGGVQVLFGVGVDVGEGEIVALLGTNGAGKSTLLRAISGQVETSRGTVVVDGRDITHIPAHRVAAHGVIQAPGGQGVFTQLSVADNLRLAAWLQRRRRDEAQARIREVLDVFPGLRERMREPAGNLSGGQQQMLTLGMAFVGRPRLLMIDELSLGLAPAIVAQLLEMVRMLSAQGTTIVLVEQSVNMALTVAERAYFMEKGEIRFEGPTAELLARPDLLRSVFLAGANGQGNGAPTPTPTPTPAATATPTSTSTPVQVPVNGQVDGRDVSPPPVLEVRDVTKRFGGVLALDGVSFDVAADEILGFIGPNGAGKTTLFDVVSGFVAADGGTIRLWSEPGSPPRALHGAPIHRRAWQGLGRSFQDGRLFPGLTVAETIAVALEQHVEVRDPIAASLRLPGVAGSERAVDLTVAELVDMLGLGAYRDKFVRELSTGTRRIVDLACVLAQGPQVVLLDEPSSGIAQREAEALGPLLRRVRRELGASLLVIEHDLPLLTSIADRMIALDLGRIVAEGDPADVVAHPRVVASYLGTDRSTIARSGELAPR